MLNEYSERVNQRLRSIFMKTFSENLVAIMSGVGHQAASGRARAAPGTTSSTRSSSRAFTREEAEALIREPVEGFFRFEPEAVERILELSASSSPT